MLQKFLEKGKSYLEESEKRKKYLPLFNAIDTFLYEAPFKTKHAPHIRDAVDLKRWMTLVVLSLLPCILVAIWNTGLQQFIYTSGDLSLMEEYLNSSTSISSYFNFALKDARAWTILRYGLIAFLPVVIISYAVGGLWEALFAVVRGHEIAEGFLVSGILYPLILPPSLPYWMVALGISLGVIIGKEVFGGTGMNILNPALTCRCFLYFAFPAAMSGEVWAGTNASQTATSLLNMNQNVSPIDAISQATTLSVFNISSDVKKVHIDAIAANSQHMEATPLLEKLQQKWHALGHSDSLGDMNTDQLQTFLTSTIDKGGLGLNPDNFQSAFNFVKLKFGESLFSDGNLFFGNMLGSMGEVSKIAILLGAFFLILTGIGSWRTMLSYSAGLIFTAFLFQFGAHFFGAYDGALNPAIFDFPIYKHFLIGGALFGLVFMATDPVSSPGMKGAQIIYGFLIGALVIIVRVINPAYPEGVMLAILFGNVFAPLLDHFAVKYYRRNHARALKS